MKTTTRGAPPLSGGGDAAGRDARVRRAVGLCGVAAGLALGASLGALSCQSRAMDCRETLSCAGAGGQPSSGGAPESGGEPGSGGNDAAGGLGGHGVAGEGGSSGQGGGAGGCPSGDPDCGGPRIVYVSPLGTAGADGSLEDPLRRISDAVELARSLDREVWACGTEGPYEETLALRAGDSGLVLRGGMDCDDFVPSSQLTEVIAQDPIGHRVQEAAGISLSGFHLRAPDAEGEGVSSVGLWLVRSESIHLSELEITAGDGSDGSDADSPGGQAEQGAAGNRGTDACVVTAGPNLGGEDAVTTCGGEPAGSVGATGGAAAGAGIATAGDGGRGEPDTTGGPGGPGGGGGTERCGDGDNGSSGSAGEDGLGSPNFGTLTSNGYQPPLGVAGKPGQVGGGGGGGGGAQKPAACATGSSGGGGGGGGCGGRGALGGMGGGGSFALVSLDSTVELEQVTLTTGKGGRGGTGGDGQAGGPGGEGGGAGQAGAELTATDACSGGNGGRGGRGGSGGGGAGGPQVGLAFSGPEPERRLVVALLPEENAAGGDGGQLNQDSGRGPQGLTDDFFELP